MPVPGFYHPGMSFNEMSDSSGAMDRSTMVGSTVLLS